MMLLPQTSSLIQQLSKKTGGVFSTAVSREPVWSARVQTVPSSVRSVPQVERLKARDCVTNAVRCGRGCRNESRADDVFSGSAELWHTRPDRVATQQLLLKAHSFHI